MPSVFKDWVLALPFRMQSVLASGLRGCDTAKKDDPSKDLVRAVRSCSMHDADPSNGFMDGGYSEGAFYRSTVIRFVRDMDSYPLHFVSHLSQAAEIIAYKHPDEQLRKLWGMFYRDIAKALDMNPETPEQLDARLGFTEVEKQLQ